MDAMIEGRATAGAVDDAADVAADAAEAAEAAAVIMVVGVDDS